MKLFRRRIAAIPQATIYAPLGAGSLIAAAIYDNHESTYYEQEDVAVIEQWRNAETLGMATWGALARFRRKDRNLYDVKLTDWPAYRASGVRSVKQFEATYLRIHVEALNEAAIIFQASALPPKESEIALRVTFSKGASDKDVGALLLRLIASCVQWKPPEPNSSLEGDAAKPRASG
jgi:hypothetical protein